MSSATPLSNSWFPGTPTRLQPGSKSASKRSIPCDCPSGGGKVPQLALAKALKKSIVGSSCRSAELAGEALTRSPRVFELTRERAEQLLDSVVDPTAWEPGPLAGIELLHFDPGPGLAGADAGLVRFAPGTPFPRHTHLGREVMIVLEGSYTEGDGTLYGAGSRVDNPAGSSHAFVCDAREGCLAGVILFEGIDIEGYGSISVKKPCI